MKRIRMAIERIPTWTMTCIVVAVVAWLTLASKPVGDMQPLLFKGADKIAHALMFAGIATAFMLDLHKHYARRLTATCRVSACLIAAMLGIGSEMMQHAMHAGRTFEWGDVAADSIGALLAFIAWNAIEKTFFSPYDNNG